MGSADGFRQRRGSGPSPERRKKHRLQQPRPDQDGDGGERRRTSSRQTSSRGPRSSSRADTRLKALATAILEAAMELGEEAGGAQGSSWESEVAAILPPPACPFLRIPGIGSEADDRHAGGGGSSEVQVLDAAAIAGLVQELGRQGGAEVALAVLDAMEAGGRGYATRNPDVLLALLRTAEARADAGVALEGMGRLGGPGCAATRGHYNAAIGACAKAAAVSQAEALFKSMAAAGVEMDVVTFNNLITAHQRSGDWKRALEIQREMEDAGVRSNSFTYGALMTALKDAGEWELAMDSIAAMQASRVNASPIVYSTAIAACLNAQQLEHAAEILLSMPKSLVPLTPGTCYQLLEFCHSQGRCGEGLKIFEEVRKAGGLQHDPDVRAGRRRAPMTASFCYSKLVIMCQAAGDADGCMRAYRWMKEDNVQVTQGVYSHLVAALSKAGHWRRCLEAVRCMRADGHRPDTVTCGDLVSCLSGAGKWDTAMAELRAIMSDEGLDKPGKGREGQDPYYIYHGLISSAGRAGQLHHALQVPAMMLEHGMRPSVTTVNHLLSACADNRALEPAMRIFSSMKERGISPDVVTYSALITCCGNAGDCNQAQKVWALLQAEDGLQLDTVAYNSMLSALGKNGQVERALALFDDMQARGIMPDSLSCDQMIGVYQQQGSWEKMSAAVRLKEWMSEQGFDPAAITFSQLIAKCDREGGSLEEAMRLFDDMEIAHVKPDSVTMTTLISSCAKAGRWKKANEIKERMLRLAVPQTLETFNALLDAAASCGLLEEGLELLEEMRVLGISPDVVSYSTLISACSQSGGRWEEAVQLFAEMRESGVRPNLITFNNLLMTCRAAGQWQPALQVFRYMTAHGGLEPNQAIYSCVIETLAAAKNWRAAVRLYQEAARNVGGIFNNYPTRFSPSGSAIIDLHGLSVLCSEAAMRAWLLNIRTQALSGHRLTAASCLIITGRGVNSGEKGAQVQPAVVELLSGGFDSPIEFSIRHGNQGALVVSTEVLHTWLLEHETTSIAPGASVAGGP